MSVTGKFILISLGSAMVFLVPAHAVAQSECEKQIVALTWQCMGQSLNGDASGCRAKAERQANCNGGTNPAASHSPSQPSGSSPVVPAAPQIAKPQPSGPSKQASPKCPSGNSARNCVTLEQRGTSGPWHNFRLVNSCDARFSVPVFSCNAEWAGGCSVTQITLGPCATTGSASEGNQSWNQDAQLRW